MIKPKLIIIAGSPGSGKSTFSKLFKDNIVIYNYDDILNENFNLLSPNFKIEEKKQIAHDYTEREIKKQIEKCVKLNLDYYHESNLDEPLISLPKSLPEHFRSFNYQIELYFLCLESKERAKERVAKRKVGGGHFVSDEKVDNKYELGYQNLNQYWNFFDSIKLFETSNSIPSLDDYFLKIENGKLTFINNFPNYLKSLIPNIEKLVI